ncbi:hypothetical protein [Novacetimonas pomaceti]|uniref:hypothetical protein n=1 Tax=Novacetimonas pomaceti TaxID=2021998 RepID=UPI0014028B8E|nr:hypothetical protein [Novacetimonas pomaceti]
MPTITDDGCLKNNIRFPGIAFFQKGDVFQGFLKKALPESFTISGHYRPRA